MSQTLHIHHVSTITHTNAIRIKRIKRESVNSYYQDEESQGADSQIMSVNMEVDVVVIHGINIT